MLLGDSTKVPSVHGLLHKLTVAGGAGVGIGRILALGLGLELAAVGSGKGRACARRYRKGGLEIVGHIHDVPAEVAELDVALIHPAHQVADLVGEGHHGAGFVLEKVRPERDDAGAGVESAKGFGHSFQFRVVAGEGAHHFYQLGHFHDGHLVRAAEDQRHRPAAALCGTHHANGIGEVGEDLSVVVGFERWLGERGGGGEERGGRPGVSHGLAASGGFGRGSGIGESHVGLALLRLLLRRLLAVGFVGFALQL